MQQGIQQGELVAKKAMAETLLKKGYPQDMVAEVTGLSQDAIPALAQAILH